jgi:sugar fermentation stimulation protein A
LLFLVQRPDCHWVEPADDIDPAFGRALRDAARRGVSVFAWRVRPTARALYLESQLEVHL